jgi:pimeloyl-ACP methyl ester carboxylesterase
MTTRIAAVAVAVILVATGCNRGVPTRAKASPTPRTESVIAWTNCGGGFDCGTVTVPLDYANPDAGTIQIAINRKPAIDPAKRVGALLINPGGPGVSGIQWLRLSASALQSLNKRFDLIGFDPRGVGQSAPVQCLTSAQEQAYNALDPVLDDPQEKQAVIDASKAFAAACQQNSGKLLPFVDTPSAAKDMDLIRIALGESQLNYLGFSYGTLLGQTYAHIYPTHIRAMVLDGVLDPTLEANELQYDEVVGFEQNLQAFLADCRAHKTTTPKCGYAQSGDPGAKLMNLMQRLDSTPMSAGGRQLTRGLAITGVFGSLYDQSLWSDLDLALTMADKGDGTDLLILSDFYYSQFSLSGIEAVDCLDRPVPTDVAAYDALAPRYDKASALFGPAFQYANLQCAYWPVKPTGKSVPIDVSGAPTILLVGSTNDPVTPYAWAQAVSRQISGSVLLTRSGNGHTSFGSSSCAQDAESAYLINLTVPAPGTVCASG